MANIYSLTQRDLEKLADNSYSCWSSDAIYGKLVDLQLQNKEYEKAFKSASKIYYFANADKAFFTILRQAPDLSMKEKAAAQMLYCVDQDTAYQEVIQIKLEKNDCEGALETASQMNLGNQINAALLAIIQKTSDLKLAERAFSQMSFYTSDKDIALELLIDRFLEKSDFAGALNLLSIAGFLYCIERLFLKIIGKMEEKGLKKEDLKLIENAVDNLSFGKQKEVFQKIANQYKILGDSSEERRLIEKIQDIDKSQKQAEVVVNRVIDVSLILPLSVAVFYFGYTAWLMGVAAVEAGIPAAGVFGGMALMSLAARTFPLFASKAGESD